MKIKVELSLEKKLGTNDFLVTKYKTSGMMPLLKNECDAIEDFIKQYKRQFGYA